MNAFGLVLLLVVIRAYYRRKWHGKYPGDPLDIAWIRRRIDCSAFNGEILSCHFEKPNQLVFLVQETDVLEWRVCRHDLAHGWTFLA